MTQKEKQKYMKLALKEAYTGISKGHGGPFGAVIVKDGKFWGDINQYVVLENAEILSIDYLGSRYLLMLSHEGHQLLAESETKPNNKYINAYIRKNGMKFYKNDYLV